MAPRAPRPSAPAPSPVAIAVAALVRFETDGEVCPHGPLVAIEDQLRPAELDLRVTYVIVELTRAQAVA